MKTLLATAALIYLVIPAQAAPKAAAAKEPSQISAFAGPHNGTLNLSGDGVSAFGTTVGNFTASKKKEKGHLTLSSALTLSGIAFVLGEQYSFQKNKVTYLFSETLGGTTLSGVGTGPAKIRKNTISYSFVFTLNPSPTVISVQGTITLAKNHHVTINETLTTGGMVNVLNYQLGGRKPKK